MPGMSATIRVLEDAAFSEEAEEVGIHVVAYAEILASMSFLALVYLGGLISSRLAGMPALVGEIVVGILLGPNLLDTVPSPNTFVLLGQIGLILLVLEAGMDIDITTLKLIGSRGIVIAVVGATTPIIIGASIASALGFNEVSKIAAGCCFAPSSMGIAMKCIKKAGIVNTPVGQLIVAAAIFDDMIALVILSLLHAFADDDASTLDMLLPIISALAFLIIGGGLIVTVIPQWIEYFILSHSPTMGWDRGWVSLAIMFPLMFVFMPMTHSARASPLLGTFLAGLTFCSNHSAHKMYIDQFKRIAQWLMRIFFAASIGFQVPIKNFASREVAIHGLLFTGALLGKVATGAFVPNFAPPAMSLSCACSEAPSMHSNHMRDRMIVGFSMMAEAEFAFVIAVFCVTHQLIDQDQYAAIVFAVLLSTIIAPNLLRCTFAYYNKQLEMTLAEATEKDKLKDDMDAFDDMDSHIAGGNKLSHEDVFFCIQTKSVAAWGLQMNIMKRLCSLHLDVIDHRSWHPYRSDDEGLSSTGDVVLVNEVYVKDLHFENDDTPPEELEEYVQHRIEEIEQRLQDAIAQSSTIVKAQRWVPFIPKGGLVSPSRRDSIAKKILQEAKRYSQSRQRTGILGEDESQYVHMGEDSGDLSSVSTADESGEYPRNFNEIFDHLDGVFVGRLEGFFRRDRDVRKKRSSHRKR